jgi:hypothetical protein
MDVTDVLRAMAAAAAVVGGLAWCGLHLVGAVALLRVARLAPAPAHATTLPSVTVVVPARNERSRLAATARSLLAQRYPGRLDVILVDDDSSDGTTDLIAQLAREARESADGRRVTAVRIDELPAGWLGKAHALAVGARAATGDYLLFTDAGVRFTPDAIATAIAFATERNLDHLTLLPRFDHRGALHAGLMQAFFVGYLRRTGGRRDLGQRSPPFGFGAFNLVRRAAFEATEGFEWLRMDILDDLALAALMRRSGATAGFAVADRSIACSWYDDLAAALRGFEKNAFGGVAGYHPVRAAGLVVTLALLPVAPLLGLIAAPSATTWALAHAAAGALVLEALAARLRFGFPLNSGLVAPLTHWLMVAAVVRGGMRALRRGSVVWSGREYPLAELRRGRRVSFP